MQGGTDKVTINSGVSPRFLTYDGYLGAIGAFMNEFTPSDSLDSLENKL